MSYKQNSRINKTISDDVISISLLVYLTIMSLLIFLILITPILQMSKSPIASSLFNLFSLFCHQLFERSLCMNQYMEIANCSIDNGYIYQFPVCSRDISFYFAMFIGGIIYLILALLRKVDQFNVPNFIYLILFILPLAIDGITQLIDLRESTNQLRLVTGFLAGITMPFYIIPLINHFYLKGIKNRNIKNERSAKKMQR